MEKNVVKIYKQVRVVTDNCSEQLAFQLRPILPPPSDLSVSLGWQMPEKYVIDSRNHRVCEQAAGETGSSLALGAPILALLLIGVGTGLST